MKDLTRPVAEEGDNAANEEDEDNNNRHAGDRDNQASIYKQVRSLNTALYCIEIFEVYQVSSSRDIIPHQLGYGSTSFSDIDVTLRLVVI